MSTAGGPFHTLLCLSGPCPHDCPAAVAEGLPRDPDWSLELPGQTDLLALAREDARGAVTS